MLSSIRHPRIVRALIFAAALSGFSAAGSVARADLVQVDVAGTASGFIFLSIPFIDQPYAASVVYDSDALASSPGVFPLVSFTGFNIDHFGSGTLQIENDVTVGSSTVDRLTFSMMGTTDFLTGTVPVDNSITLTFNNNFIPAVQLPTPDEFTDALADGELLSAAGSGDEPILGYSYDATIDTVSAGAAVSAAPAPSAVLGGLALMPLVVISAVRRKKTA